MKLRHLLLLFISFFFVLPLYAEYFKHIGLSEGLTQPSVMAIYQDRLGRMWFGTKEGISQYDGTPKDIVPDVRFTMRGKSVYIIVRHVTKASYTLRSFSSEKDKIRKVTLLENHKKVDWELDDDGLKISNIHRSTKDSFPVYVLKVEYF